MSALYSMQYVGQVDVGAGAVYIGRGQIVGIDVAGGKYKGAYTEEGGRIKGSVSLTAPPGGATLVTGMPFPAGKTVVLTVDWPTNFANGQTQQVSVAGLPVRVVLEKIGDIS